MHKTPKRVEHVATFLFQRLNADELLFALQTTGFIQNKKVMVYVWDLPVVLCYSVIQTS